MDFKYDLQETLTARFEGEWTEVEDIVNHGISGGFHGFIYTYEINEFYNEFESEIEDYVIDELGYTFEMLSEGVTSFQDIKNKCVWIVAESFCHHKVDLVDEACAA